MPRKTVAGWLVPLALIGLVPVGTGDGYLLSVLTLVGIYSLVVVSFDLLVGYSGQFSFGVNGFFAIGAYVPCILNLQYGVPTLLAIIIGMLICGLMALILGYPCSRLSGFYLAIATLGFGMVIYELCLAMSDITGGESGLIGLQPLTIAGHQLTGSTFYFRLSWLLVFLAVTGFGRLLCSRHGRAILALSQDETAAQCMGVKVQFYRVVVFVISGVVTGLAGGLYAFYQEYVVPANFGISMSIEVFLMLLFGGQRTLWGGILGVLLLKFLPELAGGLGDYKLMMYGVVFMLVLIFMPMGMADALRKAVRWATVQR